VVESTPKALSYITVCSEDVIPNEDDMFKVWFMRCELVSLLAPALSDSILGAISFLNKQWIVIIGGLLHSWFLVIKRIVPFLKSLITAMEELTEGVSTDETYHWI